MAWSTSASTRPGQGRRHASLLPMALAGAAAIAKPTRDAGASSQEESINRQSLRFAPRRVPTGSDPALNVR
jgi:hypothetical protein